VHLPSKVIAHDTNEDFSGNVKYLMLYTLVFMIIILHSKKYTMKNSPAIDEFGNSSKAFIEVFIHFNCII
jgi:hypothetical protein